MSPASHRPLDPDELNELWDRLVDGRAQGGANEGSAEASIIGWLQAAAPGPALPRPVWTGAEREPRQASQADPAGRPALPSRTGRGRLGTWQPLASGALAVALIVAILFAKPVRDLWQQELQRGVGSPSEETVDLAPGTGRSLLSILVRPGEAEDGSMDVGLWEVTLASGSVLHVPGAIQDLGNQAFEGWIASGAVIVGASGAEHDVEAGSTTATEPVPEYLRNAGAAEARMLLLVPMNDTETFPLELTGAQEGDGWATPHPDTYAHLLDTVSLDARDAAQHRVTVLAETRQPGTASTISAVFGTREMTVHSTTVFRGEMTVNQAPQGGTPAVIEILTEGETLDLRGVDRMPEVVATGDENLTLLTLTSTPWSDNPTLDQTVDPVAPFRGEWMVPASGDVNVAVRSLAIEPRAAYRLHTGAGVMYYLADGDLSATNEGTGLAGTLAPGSVVAQRPDTVLSFSNPSDAPARLVQVLVFAGGLEEAVVNEQFDGAGARVLAQATSSLPPGLASLMLESHEFNGVNDGGTSGSGGTSLTLLLPIDGAIEVRRDGGDAAVTGPDGEPRQPPLGEGIELAEGSFMLVQPGGDWAVTGADGEAGTGLVLSVSPVVDTPVPGSGTPVATPGTITLQGDPVACTVVPLTSSNVDNLMATPTASGDPLSRSGRDQAGVAADAGTAAAIVGTMQGYADCWATGTYALAATFMSDQAIRESESMREFIASDFEAGVIPHVDVAIEDIVLFPDGRAGARVVMNGEAAYVTFVTQEGRWLIDVWDDRDGVPSTQAPQAG